MCVISIVADYLYGLGRYIMFSYMYITVFGPRMISLCTLWYTFVKKWSANIVRYNALHTGTLYLQLHYSSNESITSPPLHPRFILLCINYFSGKKSIFEESEK